MCRYFIPLWAFLSLSLATSEHCSDEQNQPISSCDRCLWRPDCHWCPTMTSNLARGCIRKTIPCSDTPIISKPKVRVQMAVPINRNNWISPQKVKLELSPQTPANVHFEAELFDLPVDIYFLMDLSNSMSIHKENLQNTAGVIANEVMSLTSDFRFGFGSFSDKPTPPFASELATYKYLINSGRRRQPPPYSFHHHVSMTQNATFFRQKVSDSLLAGNIDSPEAGMDALMQVLACGEIIKWRQDVRKVIIFITDEDSHFAYDGYLGGITIPNDGECHLKKSNEGEHYYYDKELQMDYPSFGHIADKMSQKNMAVIFAVDSYMESLYKELSKFLQGTVNVGILGKESSSLTSIVTQQYRQIKSRLALEATSDNKDLELQLKADKCENPTLSSIVCSNVTQGQPIKFQLQITAKESLCRNPERDNQITVSIVGSSNHQLTVELGCEQCQCENGVKIPNAQECDSKGTFHCGGCICDQDRVGRQCECELTQTTGDLKESCIEKGQAIPCNGRGDCNCGVCQCQGKFRGEFCQCHADQCPTKEPGIPCSGHGHCSCDKDSQTSCTCYEGWSGLDCSCAQNFDVCKTKFMQDPCMGRGTCVCGECQCQSGYYGKYCQKSTSMTTCEKLEPCVKLKTFKPEGEDADEIHAEWMEECKENLFMGQEYVFGGMQNVLKACQKELDESSLIFEPDSSHDLECEDLFKRYDAEQLAQELERRESNGTSSPTKRGDINIWTQERILLMDTSNMERCVGYKDRCAFSFYHENIEEDKYFSMDPEKDPGKVLVAFRNVSGTYQAITSCTAIPMAVIMGSSIGLLLLIGIILLVTAIVIVNINDLRRWKQYQAWKAENERQLGEQANPLYESKTTTFQNPSFNS